MLSHLRALDLSRILAGPWASQLLGDLGADIVKIERPGVGDDTRGWGPPFQGADAAYFRSANRSKRSVTVDLAQEAGQGIVRRLARRADVLIENFRVGALAAYGLDYAALAVVNPRLVYCSITGFGQTGPYAARAGYDFLIQGMGGLMSVTGRADAEPGAGPQKVGVALADILTGLYASNAILAALAHRDISGLGQHIDLALLDVQVAALANQAANYLATGVAPGRQGNAHPNIVPYQDFPTADGDMIVAVGNDAQFARLSALVGADWAARYPTNASRVEGRGVLIREMRAVTIGRDTADWIAALETIGVPCGPINRIDQVFADPQIVARGMKIVVDGGELVANPIRFSATPVQYRQPPPALGAHTDEVLGELGYSPAEIGGWRDQGVI